MKLKKNTPMIDLLGARAAPQHFTIQVSIPNRLPATS
jgi:hypothetical protein